VNCEKVLQTIDALEKEYRSLWEDVCNIESPTDHKAGVDQVGLFVAGLAEKQGWKVEFFRQPVSGDVVCITMNEEAEGKPVSLSGHMDTVHPVGMFGSPAVRKEKEKIYGPGVTDCKGGIIAAMLAMDALKRCGFSSRPVQLLLQSDEETGSKGSNKETIRYICEKAKDSIAFLNLEGHTKGVACLERKGIVTFTFTVTGQEAHSSKCATLGANAILEAAHKIIELENIKDEDGLTCCCSTIQGGTVPNTVPGSCVFQANVRFATAEQLAWMREKVQEVANRTVVPGCSCRVDQPEGRPAMELTKQNEALLETVNKIYQENGLPVLEKGKRTGGSDGADVTAFGIPCIDSLGAEGDGIHSIDEFAWLSSLAESAKRIASVVYCI